MDEPIYNIGQPLYWLDVSETEKTLMQGNIVGICHVKDDGYVYLIKDCWGDTKKLPETEAKDNPQELYADLITFE